MPPATGGGGFEPACADCPLEQREPPPEEAVGGEGDHAEGVAGLELEDAGDDLGDASVSEGEGHDDGDRLMRQKAGVDGAEHDGGEAEAGKAERAGIGRLRDDDWREWLRFDGSGHR